MLVAYRVLALLGCIAAFSWLLMESNKFDPWVAAAGALALLASSFLPQVVRRLNGSMTQKVDAHAVGIQIGGDGHVSVVQKSRDTGDV